jgi:hypothetical protein
MPKSKALVPFIRGYQIKRHDFIVETPEVLHVYFTGPIHNLKELPTGYRGLRSALVNLDDVLAVGLDVQEYWEVKTGKFRGLTVLWLTCVAEEDL